ncbi:uncharacterized protein ACR2FA_003393 [Aphomia sociella]
MKAVLILLALVSLGCAAPQQRKVFHENVEDFLSIIQENIGQELLELMFQYHEFEEFQVSVTFMRTANFKALINEMESLPEFKAVINFLENNNIDILYFLDRFNNLLEQAPEIAAMSKNSRIEPSGRDFTSFIKDSIKIFPKDELSALYDQKMADDEEFSVAMNNLYSEEWSNTYDALWKSEQFLAEIKILGDNGIDFEVLVLEILAVFGQN